jgi:DNA-binding SARP family transcriptional activator
MSLRCAFRILGPLEVESGKIEIHVGGRRQQNLLGMLLVSAGQIVSIDHLVDVTWESKPPQSASKQVRNVVSDLRVRLAGTSAVISAVASGYRLDTAPEDLDRAVFKRLVEQARHDTALGRRDKAIAGLRTAVDLWRGPALAGLTSMALQPQVTRLNEERLATFEDFVDLVLAAGGHRAIVSELWEWVATNPLRERLAARLMLALYRSDRQADALVVYERTRRALAERLGIDPGANLRRLRQRVLVNDHTLNRRSEPAVFDRADSSVEHGDGFLLRRVELG